MQVHKSDIKNQHFNDLYGGMPIEKKKPGFLKRQLRPKPTKNQVAFDVIFGIVLPAICFYFDPIVFREGFGPPILGEYKYVTYILSYISIMALLAFILFGRKLGGLNAFLCGWFLGAAAASLVIGGVLFPFSVIGLIILLGALGFTPLFTGFVFLRNAFRAYDAAGPDLDEKLNWRLRALGVISAICLPIALSGVFV